VSGTNELLARNIRRFRQERKLSLGDLARKSGLSKQTLSKIEQGVGNPTVDSLTAIAAALDVTLRRLITEWGSPVLVQRLDGAAWNGEAGWQVRPLAQIYGSGYVRTSILRLAKGDRGRGSFGQGEPGTLHHVYAVEGRVRAGLREEPLELAAGDFVRFPGDAEHVFECLTAAATLHIVTTVPQVPQFGPAGG
jgi:transcriptional regulator with XRE-family HTH domain